jgi:hypothetical protein
MHQATRRGSHCRYHFHGQNQLTADLRSYLPLEIPFSEECAKVMKSVSEILCERGMCTQLFLRLHASDIIEEAYNKTQITKNNKVLVMQIVHRALLRTFSGEFVSS